MFTTARAGTPHRTTAMVTAALVIRPPPAPDRWHPQPPATPTAPRANTGPASSPAEDAPARRSPPAAEHPAQGAATCRCVGDHETGSAAPRPRRSADRRPGNHV